MKKQILTIALGVLTVSSFAQKNELKAAEKAVKNQDFTTAVTSINSAEALIANADAKSKSKFYFLKAQAFGGKKDYETAANAYNELFAFEKETGKKRYTDKAMPLLELLKNEINDKAFMLHGEKNLMRLLKLFIPDI
jgi:hypothetical protein